MTQTGYALVDGDPPATPRHWLVCTIAVIVAQWLLGMSGGALNPLAMISYWSGSEDALLFQVAMFVYIAGPFVLIGWLAAYLARRFDGRGHSAIGLSRRALPQALPWILVGIVAATPTWLRLFQTAPYWYEAVALLVLAPATLLQSGAEEILFRGVLLPMLVARYGGGRGLLVSAGLFALWHIYPTQPAADILVRAGTTFVAGLTLGIVALRQGHLGGAIALHFVWNFFVFAEAGFLGWSQGFWLSVIASFYATWSFADLANGATVRQLMLPLAIETICVMLICRTTVLELIGGRSKQVERPGDE
jgi:membrane protease YdiL (CAAX protease family)